MVERSASSPNTTKLGKLWAQRRKVAENRRKRESKDWEALRKLYAEAYEQKNRWGGGVSLAWSIINNLIADSYFRNPEPMIFSRRPDGRSEVDHMLRDVTKTIHKTAKTEQNIKRGMVLNAFSIAAHWVDFKQRSQYAPVRTDQGILTDEAGEVVYEKDEKGHRMMEAVEQKIVHELLDGWSFLNDPDGRRWDLDDSKWFSRDYTLTLQQFIDDPDFTKESKDRLRTHQTQRARNRGRQYAKDYDEGYDEKDPAMQPVTCAEIWDRVKKKIIHVPVGAEFHLAGSEKEGYGDGFPWPQHWADTDLFPVVVQAYGWNPPDEQGRFGFYPVPTLRLIREPLQKINHYEGLLFNALRHSVHKYLVPKGLFNATDQRRVQSDVDREMIEVSMKDFMTAAGITGGVNELREFNMDRLITQMKSEDKTEAVFYLQAIAHQLDIIHQTIGQGSGDRGGISEADSATESLQIGEKLRQRANVTVEETADVADAITHRDLILLKSLQTLPMPYQQSSEYAEEGTWQIFLADDIRDLEFIVSHRAGSSKPFNKDVYQHELREAIQQMIPVLQTGNDPRINFLARKLFETFETFDRKALERHFNDELPAIVEQSLMMMYAIMNGQVDPADDRVALRLVQLFGDLLKVLATPDQIERVSEQVAGATGGGASGGRKTGSPAKSRSDGQKAYAQTAALGAAGATNV